jgi:diaminopimelate decarboxylase
MLPRLDAGDLVAVPDTGAYYFSNPFSYNLLPRVPVYGYRTSGDAEVGVPDPDVTAGESSTKSRLGEGEPQFFLIRRGQTIDDVLAEAGEPDLDTLGLVGNESE